MPTPKIHPKISHIIKGFPLSQDSADFEIRSGKINLNGLIDTCGNKVADVGGRFYYREGVHQTCVRTPKIHPKICHII